MSTFRYKACFYAVTIAVSRVTHRDPLTDIQSHTQTEKVPELSSPHRNQLQGSLKRPSILPQSFPHRLMAQWMPLACRITQGGCQPQCSPGVWLLRAGNGSVRSAPCAFLVPSWAGCTRPPSLERVSLSMTLTLPLSKQLAIVTLMIPMYSTQSSMCSIKQG